MEILLLIIGAIIGFCWQGSVVNGEIDVATRMRLVNEAYNRAIEAYRLASDEAHLAGEDYARAAERRSGFFFRHSKATEEEWNAAIQRDHDASLRWDRAIAAYKLAQHHYNAGVYDYHVDSVDPPPPRVAWLTDERYFEMIKIGLRCFFWFICFIVLAYFGGVICYVEWQQRRYRRLYIGPLVDSTECVICWETMKPGEIVSKWPCKHQHAFHEDCIVPWIGIHKQDTCPICRIELV